MSSSTTLESQSDCGRFTVRTTALTEVEVFATKHRRVANMRVIHTTSIEAYAIELEALREEASAVEVKLNKSKAKNPAALKKRMFELSDKIMKLQDEASKYGEKIAMEKHDEYIVSLQSEIEQKKRKRDEEETVGNV